MVYHIMYMNTEVATVLWDNNKKHIKLIKLVPDSIIQPFSGKNFNIIRFYEFIKSRCYEDNRDDLNIILKKAGMNNNNPYEWIRLTHGVTWEDAFWIKFDDENITWEDVKVR